MVNYYAALADVPEVTPGETSYFSSSEETLDPKLFVGLSLRPPVRSSILALLHNTVNAKFQGSESWLHAWLAGSGVSYNWKASRQPADLDCLVGIDYPSFRRANPSYAGFSDKDIADMFNELFRSEMHTDNFMNTYDLTFYVNVKSNILDIKPYSAYSLTDDSWTVPPQTFTIEHNPAWDSVTASDFNRATDIVNRYKTHYAGVKQAQQDAVRRNHEVALRHTLAQASALFDEIHEGRKQAFSSAGEGYRDFTNYRWQSGKKSGIINPLKTLKKAHESFGLGESYGLSLPTADTMIRRAASQYLNR